MAALAGTGLALGRGSAASGGASDPRLMAVEGPPATAPWPTPGFSEAELRPVVEALVQLATGASPGPSVAPPDPAPSSSPPATGLGRAEQDATTNAPAPPPSSSAAPWIVVVVVLMVLAGAGIVTRRRLRARGRAPAGPPRPPAGSPATGTDPTGAGAESPAPLGPAQRVDLALRHAWAVLARAGRSDRPSVLAVRVGGLGVEVLLDAAMPDAPGMFVASEDGRAWTLGADMADEELRRGAGDEPPPLPALLTVGSTPEGPALIDLLHVGALSVEGDPDRVAGFVAGAALELATAPWAQGVIVGLAGGDLRLAALANVVTLGPPVSEAPGARMPASLERRVQEWLEAASGIAALAVAPGAASAGEIDGVADAVRSRSGRAGLVAAGPLPGAAWRLVIGEDGQGILHPLGLEAACAVDAGAVAAAVDALSTPEAGPAPTGTVGDGDPEPQPAGPAVAVLGPVVVRWPDLPGGRRPTRRKLEEVVAYLATHSERPVPAERLRTAVWPLSEDDRAGEVADSSFRATMSRARAALGSDGEGRPYLPDARQGCYALDASVGCDWVEFTVLVRQARFEPAPQAARLLRRALELVRGVPFADVPKGAYGWAWTEQLVSVIEVAVADAAERLAELALEAGDHRTARWASAKGLLVVPSREALYRARMRAAFEAGDLDDVEQAYLEVRRAARAVDDAEEPQTQTTALYERLRRAARRGSTDTVEATERLVAVR